MGSHNLGRPGGNVGRRLLPVAAQYRAVSSGWAGPAATCPPPPLQTYSPPAAPACTDASVVGQLARSIDFPGQFSAGLLAIKRDDKNVRWSQTPGGQLGEQTIQVRRRGYYPENGALLDWRWGHWNFLNIDRISRQCNAHSTLVEKGFLVGPLAAHPA